MQIKTVVQPLKGTDTGNTDCPPYAQGDAVSRWYSQALIQVNNVITNDLHKSDICWPLKHGSSEYKVDWQK